MKRLRYLFALLLVTVCVSLLSLPGEATGTTVESGEHVSYYGMIANGQKVADLQNVYMTVYQDKQAYNVVYGSLKQYIDDPLECRVWYGQYTWEFATKYATNESTQKALWFGKDESGEVRAFCTGTYDYTTGKFSNIKWNVYGRMDWDL